MDQQLNSLYYGCTDVNCQHDHHNFTMSADDEWASILAQLLAQETQRVWNEKGMPKQINQRLTDAYASVFMDAVQEGYGVDFGNIDYETPDRVMLQKLVENTYQFSAAKNYTQLRQLSQALVGPDGKLRSFAEFRQAAFEINNAHVDRYLKTEYNTAVGSAQMARKWNDIQQNKDSLPLLEFDAIIDGQTSDLCRGFDKVVKPVNDPFWNTYYPPNHFGCRSIVNQLRSGRITQDASIVYPERGIPEMFRTNLAKSGMIFPPAHPYWIGVPENVKADTIKLYPYDMQFEEIDPGQYKGTVRKHRLLQKSEDYNLHLQIAAEKASAGHHVDIMPVIEQYDKAWRSVVFHDAVGNKNADLRIDGVLTEVKSPLQPIHSNKLKHAIGAASNQANHVIIDLKTKVNKGQQWKIVRSKFKQHKKLRRIEFRIDGAYQQWDK